MLYNFEPISRKRKRRLDGEELGFLNLNSSNSGDLRNKGNVNTFPLLVIAEWKSAVSF